MPLTVASRQTLAKHDVTPETHELIPFRGVRIRNVVRGSKVTFEVADVDAAIDHLRRLGFKVFDEPKDRPWGKRDAGVLDPEGNEV